jgi:hypothetical protein
MASPSSPPPPSFAASASESSECTAGFSGCWNAVCCNDDLNLVNYYVQGVGRDMYWPPNVPAGWSSLTYADQLASLIGPDGGEPGRGCQAPPGVVGYPPTSDAWSHWLTTELGGLNIDAHSNILFSNGLLDPWSAAGVYPGGADPPPPGPYDGPALRNVTATIQSLVLDLGAHHLDLMFLDDADPPCAFEARDIEAASIKRWAAEFKATAAKRKGARRGP